MKIGIVSDTHGSTRVIDAMLERPEAQEVAFWLHAGDVTTDADYLAMMTEKTVHKVAGNCDWPGFVPDETIVEAAGHRIFLAHGHTYGAQYDTDRLIREAASQDCDIVVYGHTHCAEFLPAAITVVNPGSLARPRDDAHGSFLILTLEPDHLPEGELIRMEYPDFFPGMHGMHIGHK